MEDKIFTDAENSVSGMEQKGEDWVKGQIDKLEELARDKTDMGKKKLVNFAKQHGVNANEQMGAEEVKEKVKQKLGSA